MSEVQEEPHPSVRQPSCSSAAWAAESLDPALPSGPSRGGSSAPSQDVLEQEVRSPLHDLRNLAGGADVHPGLLRVFCGMTWLGAMADFPDYWCSADGAIFSTKVRGLNRPRRRFAFLTQREHPRSGHPRVDLRDWTGKKMTVYVHKLVALTWLGRPRPNYEVCHKDGVPENNTVENLYWGTRSQNALDRERHARERAATAVTPTLDADGFDWSTGAFAECQSQG